MAAWFYLALAVLSFYRHRENIKRLVNGTESKIHLKKEPTEKMVDLKKKNTKKNDRRK